MKLLKQEKMKLLCIFGKNPNSILQAMSSEYCEEDEKEFRENYGISFSEAIKLIAKFIKQLEN